MKDPILTIGRQMMGHMLDGACRRPSLAAGLEAAYDGPVAIKFHYHTARKDVPRLGIERGDPLCHVYSDDSLDELLAWGRRHGLRPEWIDRRSALPHFDLFGRYLAHCGDGVERAELVRDIRSWRARSR